MADKVLIDPHSLGTVLKAGVVVGKQHIGGGTRFGAGVDQGLGVQIYGTGVDALVGEQVKVVAVGTGRALDALAATGLGVEDIAVDAGGAGVSVLAGEAGN